MKNILILMFSVLLMSCASHIEWKRDESIKPIKIENQQQLTEIKNKWESKKLYNYQIKYRTGAWISSQTNVVSVRKSVFHGGYQYDNRDSEKVKRLKEGLTLALIFDLAEKNIDNPNYTFYTNSTKDLIIGYGFDDDVEDGWWSVFVEEIRI
jgi:hypothetical protein